MKRIILAVAMVIGVAQGVDTKDKKTLLVGVLPHEFAKRDYYKKLAPNTGLWVLTDTYDGSNEAAGEKAADYYAGFISFYGKKVGFNGARDHELDYNFGDIYGARPNKEFIQQLLMDFQNNPNMHGKQEILDNVTKNGVLDDEGVRFLSDKSFPSTITDPMIMYGMSFFNDRGLTPEGRKHKDKFDTVIVDQNVMKFLVGDTAKENVVRAVWALNALLKVGGDLIVLNPGDGLRRTKVITQQESYDWLIKKGIAPDVAKKHPHAAVGLQANTDDLDPSVEKEFSRLKGIMFGDVQIEKDTFSGYGGPMIRFHNKRKDRFGDQHGGAGNEPVWNIRLIKEIRKLIEEIRKDIAAYDPSKDTLIGTRIGILKSKSLEMEKHIEHCQKLENGKNSSQCAEAQKYVQDGVALLDQAGQIPSLGHYVFGDVPVWNIRLIEEIRRDIAAYDPSKDTLIGTRMNMLKDQILEMKKYIEHCQKFESGKNSSQCAKAQQYMEDGVAVLKQGWQIPSFVRSVFGDQHGGAGNAPVLKTEMLEWMRKRMEENDPGKDSILVAQIARLKNKILEAQKYIEHCQELENGKNSSQCAEAQQYMEDAFALLNQARQIPSLAHHVDQQ